MNINVGPDKQSLMCISLIIMYNNGSLSYTPTLFHELKVFRGVLNFEDHFSMTKYLIKHPVVYFLSSVLTFKNSSEIYVIRTHYN